MAGFEAASGMSRRVLAFWVGLALFGAACLVWVGCGSSSAGAEREEGFANVYLGEIEPGSWTLELATSYQRGDEPWQSVRGLRLGNVTVDGLGLAQRPGDGRMLLGYTVDGTMKLHRSSGLKFARQPVQRLKGVAVGPGIAHVSGDSWLLAYTLPNGDIVVRPFDSSGPARFGPPLDLPGTQRDTRPRGRPAIAYADGRLVLVWGRSGDARLYRYLAADYEPRTGSANVVGEGRVPKPPRDFSDYIAEPQSSPALADDGAGNFYLGAVYRGVSGRQFDTIRIYSSQDGAEWQAMDRPFPGGNKFHTGWTHVGLAARAAEGEAAPAADLVLAVISGGNPGTTLEFSAADGYWRNTEEEAFGKAVTYYNEAITATRLAPEGQ